MFINLTNFLVKIFMLIFSLTITHFAYAETNTISLAQVTKDVSYLSSNKLNGRGNYSQEIRLAANYIAKRFLENGLMAVKSESTSDFFQRYQTTKITPTNISLLINGQKFAPEVLTMASTVTEFSWEFRDNIKSVDFEIHSINQHDNFQAIMSKLNSQGGKHLVLINPVHKKRFERCRDYFQRGLTRLVQQQSIDNAGSTIVLALSDNTAEQVESVSLSGISTLSKNEFINVVGILLGKTKPDEIILYSAHYDHLGIKMGESDAIYNGADDNASGTTAMINLAEYYAKQGNNARTLMFAGFSAEELGGLGSSYFSTQLDPQKITAMINIEMVGKPSKFGLGTLWMTGVKHSTLFEQSNNVLKPFNKKIYQDPYPEQSLFYRSDNANLAKLGVPAHTFSSAQLDKDSHYHQTSDVFSTLNLSSLYQIIKLLAVTTQPLVDGIITPSRIDKKLLKKKGLIF